MKGQGQQVLQSLMLGKAGSPQIAEIRIWCPSEPVPSPATGMHTQLLPWLHVVVAHRGYTHNPVSCKAVEHRRITQYSSLFKHMVSSSLVCLRLFFSYP